MFKKKIVTIITAVMIACTGVVPATTAMTAVPVMASENDLIRDARNRVEEEEHRWNEATAGLAELREMAQKEHKKVAEAIDEFSRLLTSLDNLEQMDKNLTIFESASETLSDGARSIERFSRYPEPTTGLMDFEDAYQKIADKCKEVSCCAEWVIRALEELSYKAKKTGTIDLEAVSDVSNEWNSVTKEYRSDMEYFFLNCPQG